MLDQIQTVAVVGAGQMGAGIAQTFASVGFKVFLYDAAEPALKSAIAGIAKRLDRLVEKSEMTKDQRDAAAENVHPISGISELANVDLLVEAIVEDFAIKASFFKGVDTLCKPETIFASNTSSVSITKLAGATKRPDRFIGMHFMNPVPVMALVEIIRGLQTSDATYDLSKSLVEKLGKTPVTARKDYPGFIVNRILIPMLNEACFVLMEGIATPEEIDTAMKLGTNQPMGPLELADFVGLDTCLAICRIFHNELGEDKYRPCPLLVKYVEAGWFGKKTGRGFYRYEPKR